MKTEFENSTGSGKWFRLPGFMTIFLTSSVFTELAKINPIVANTNSVILSDITYNTKINV